MKSSEWGFKIPARNYAHETNWKKNKEMVKPYKKWVKMNQKEMKILC